jgi:hypothetical protein
MKRFILCLVAFTFITTFTYAQAQRIGSLAEIEKGNADLFVANSLDMAAASVMTPASPLYEQYASMLKNNVIAAYTTKGNVLVVLLFPREATDDPKMLQAYYTVFGYGFSEGLLKAKDDTEFIIVNAQQSDGSIYGYFFPTASIKALLSGSIQMADFEQQAYVTTGASVND